MFCVKYSHWNDGYINTIHFVYRAYFGRIIFRCVSKQMCLVFCLTVHWTNVIWISNFCHGGLSFEKKWLFSVTLFVVTTYIYRTFPLLFVLHFFNCLKTCKIESVGYASGTFRNFLVLHNVYVVVVDQFTPGYQFRPTLNFLEDL